MTTPEEIKALVEKLLHNSDTATVLEAADAIEALSAQVAELRAERDDLQSRIDELEQNGEAVGAEFEGDCWKAMRRLLDACDFDWQRVDPIDGLPAADAEEWIRETIENIEGETKYVQAENERLTGQVTFWKDTANANIEWAYRDRNRAIAAEKRLAEVEAEEDRWRQAAINQQKRREQAEAHRDRLVSALRRPIGMQDVRLRVGEGKLSQSGILAGVNAELRHRSALSASGPDVVKETARRCVEIARQYGNQILVMWDRPGSAPGNGWRQLTGEDVAQAIAREFSLEDGNG